MESFFRGYNALDRDSLIPVVKSGLFRGLRRDLVRLTGRLADFRGGALEFVRTKNVETWIVSQSWYGEMVAEALRPAGVSAEHVITSRLVYGPDGTAGGALDARCGGCLAKRDRVREILRGETPARNARREDLIAYDDRGNGETGETGEPGMGEGSGEGPAGNAREIQGTESNPRPEQSLSQSPEQSLSQSSEQSLSQGTKSTPRPEPTRQSPEQSMSQGSTPGFSVGIGDGLGDLAMLLETDLPIVLHPGSTFRAVCSAFGLALRPLLLLDGPPSPRTLYIADDWAQILAVLCLPHLDAALQPLPTPPRRHCDPAECRLMALTSDALNAEAGDAMERAILQSIDGGATMVQIRDKTEDFGPISGIP